MILYFFKYKINKLFLFYSIIGIGANEFLGNSKKIILFMSSLLNYIEESIFHDKFRNVFELLIKEQVLML